jgi:hypothetical protein
MHQSRHPSTTSAEDPGSSGWRQAELREIGLESAIRISELPGGRMRSDHDVTRLVGRPVEASMRGNLSLELDDIGIQLAHPLQRRHVLGLESALLAEEGLEESPGPPRPL